MSPATAATTAPTTPTKARAKTKHTLAPVPATTEPKPFGPGSMMWDDMGDLLFVAAAGGAFILQVMHPTISAAIDEHSVFLTDTAGRGIRSLDSMMLWVYGGQAAIDEGERLRVMHRKIQGTAPDGEHYAALESEAWGWVHATAYVTAMQTFPYLRGRMPTAAEEDQSYDEFLQLGHILRVPEKVLPATKAEYWDYYDWMLRERLQHTGTVDDLLGVLSNPKLRLVPGPVDPLGRAVSRVAGDTTRLLALGGLRPDAREKIGVTWTSRDELRLRAFMAAVRPVWQRLPERMRYAPLALHARRHARELERARRRASPVAMHP